LPELSEDDLVSMVICCFSGFLLELTAYVVTVGADARAALVVGDVGSALATELVRLMANALNSLRSILPLEVRGIEATYVRFSGTE
jgi:hypothetical protein